MNFEGAPCGDRRARPQIRDPHVDAGGMTDVPQHARHHGVDALGGRERARKLQVGGGDPDRTAALIAADHPPRGLVHAPQHACGELDLAAPQALTDAARGDSLPLHHHLRDLDHLKAVPFAQAVQHGHVARAGGAEVEVIADHHGTRPQLHAQHLLGKLLG
jgi:hypothetical protein